MLRSNHRFAISLLSVVAVLSHVDDAQACGGLFCDAVQPVNQVGEQIIFVDHGDGRVTSVVQISYAGPAEQFAWVLPVVGVPEISVSSNAAFQRLRTATDPSYVMNTEFEGQCAPSFGGFGCNDALASGDGGGDGDGDDAELNGVNVLGSGSVGPYEYTIIEVDPTLPDLAEEALNWLVENGYQVGSLGPDLIRPYLEETMNLVAFRLEKQADAGDVRPVVLTYSDLSPMIPIKLTAVAAEDNMGVLVWTTGPSRAVPTNYLSLVPNDALINWFNPMSNYADLVTAAADEAGGQGFVTEHATTTSSLAGTIWSEQEEAGWIALKAELFDDDAGSATQDLLQRYQGFDGAADALRAAGVDDTVAEEVLACIFCGTNESDFAGVETTALIDGFQEHVIGPMQATEALFVERPYVTRLYSTLSAPEMTLDPAFDFNPDLGDVSRIHTATRVVHCDSSLTEFEAPWSATLPSGEVVLGTGFAWPIDIDDPELPKNRTVLEDSTLGQPIVVTNNATSIRARLDALNADINPPVVSRGCAGVVARARGAHELLFMFAAVLGFRALLRRRQ